MHGLGTLAENIKNFVSKCSGVNMSPAEKSVSIGKNLQALIEVENRLDEGGRYILTALEERKKLTDKILLRNNIAVFLEESGGRLTNLSNKIV
jgi:hypothetical protein